MTSKYRFIKRIKDAVNDNGISGTDRGISPIGFFGTEFDPKIVADKFGISDPIFVMSTDGVGSKSKLLADMGLHCQIGRELIAMVVNDIVCHGARPVMLHNYIGYSELKDLTFQALMNGIVHTCKEYGIALAGGETAQMPNLYDPGELDIVAFLIGVVERKDKWPRPLLPGDVLWKVPSSGFHANGYTYVNEFIAKHKNIAHNFMMKLVEPTEIYTSVLNFHPGVVKAAVHITGGGIPNKLERILPKHLSADIKLWTLPSPFSTVMDVMNYSRHFMLETFNCGCGMILVTNPDEELPYEKIGVIVEKPWTNEGIRFTGDFS